MSFDYDAETSDYVWDSFCEDLNANIKEVDRKLWTHNFVDISDELEGNFYRAYISKDTDALVFYEKESDRLRLDLSRTDIEEYNGRKKLSPTKELEAGLVLKEPDNMVDYSLEDLIVMEVEGERRIISEF